MTPRYQRPISNPSMHSRPSSMAPWPCGATRRLPQANRRASHLDPVRVTETTAHCFGKRKSAQWGGRKVATMLSRLSTLREIS
jgi:hypothetical protein